MTLTPPGASQSPPADVCLLLRAHAEARWLRREAVPLIEELEHDLGSRAALAYLEALCIEARRHGADTDAARIELDALPSHGDHELHDKARRYHAAVRRLRSVVHARAQILLAAAYDASAYADDCGGEALDERAA
jgi:hypothetical protein